VVTKRDREVQIDVTSRHQQVSEKTRAFAIERAQKLTRYNDRISRIQVLLDEEHNQFTAEVIVHVEAGATLVSRESGDGYRTALDTLMVKIERQLKRDKEKRRSHDHETVRDMQPAGEVVPAEESYEDIVREDLIG
jgi:ribosomal subunit interface protein